MPGSFQDLPFARAVISEAMRLYPPAFLLTRVSLKDAELAGHHVRAGQRINIPIYAIHRRAAVWPDPHVFDPSRFLAASAPPDRFAYLPFGGGPRICIGAAFAMAEMITLLTTLLRSADMSLSPNARIWPQTGLALYPRHGMPMRVRVR
jgi:cytochrome P450